MKKIELTEEHKSKLLEMCKVLFAEYNKIELELECYDGLGGFIQFHHQIKDSEYIYWFEFCVSKIVNELAWRNIETEILADCEYENHRMKLITKIFKDKLVGNNFHIVDYLYKQFKKLK